MSIGIISKISQALGGHGDTSKLRLGIDGSAITTDLLTKLAFEGRIYIAGVALEGTALTGATSLAETTPDIVLKSSSGGDNVVMPLYYEALLSNEGGAAPDWYISLITADISIATAGTTVTPQCIGRVGGTASATLQTGATMSAYTNSQNCLLANSQNTLDNIISVEGATTVVLSNDLMNTQTKITWTAMAPIALRDGQSWAFHSATGTAGMQLEWTLIFADFPKSAFVIA